MPHLEIPGGSLYYETVGLGPLLLCIAGANASHLKDSFTVVMYDRRGYSRSTGKLSSQDYGHRLETHADDAAALLAHLSPSPDCDRIDGELQHVVGTFRTKGIPPAVQEFAAFIQAGYETEALVHTLAGPDAAANTT
ncbi:Uu.00g011080.m01.CDS01 [Anthostomella pinea]|uniref:Uu.00g011080.m01.CDS01 n=1 Tax=Anthostomella pinea TaxID=933095 RepID=A0AAI8VYD5_9PEZI|nr:Uu.00g011080.m01.CDS01 [Anthostomella pinea]